MVRIITENFKKCSDQRERIPRRSVFSVSSLLCVEVVDGLRSTWRYKTTYD